ncbi:hypothetical protein [Halalkalirubrum salinum]|uniref:hypothetical protein n=1 Tax=Halalkalirubrum salinum TaxID=2563889 RepID=UPI0010FB14FD|nr:hypothetical protein [Halalkalirubrum salinum]
MSEDNRETMGEISHTHPYTGETFGGVYRRGPAIADGGESSPVRTGATTDAAPESTTDAEAETETDANADTDTDDVARVRDVDHESSATANEVWARGGAVPEVPDK